MQPQALADLATGQWSVLQLVEEAQLHRHEKDLRVHEAVAKREDLGGRESSCHGAPPSQRAAQCAAGKLVSNFLLISIAFSGVRPSPAASSEIALK